MQLFFHLVSTNNLDMWSRNQGWKRVHQACGLQVHLNIQWYFISPTIDAITVPFENISMYYCKIRSRYQMFIRALCFFPSLKNFWCIFIIVGLTLDVSKTSYYTIILCRCWCCFLIRMNTSEGLEWHVLNTWNFGCFKIPFTMQWLH